MRQSIIRIKLDRFRKAVDTSTQGSFRTLIPEVPAFQIELEGFQILAVSLVKRFRLPKQSGFESLHDGLCDLILNGKNVRQFPIVTSRPKMISIRCVDQLHGD